MSTIDGQRSNASGKTVINSAPGIAVVAGAKDTAVLSPGKNIAVALANQRVYRSSKRSIALLPKVAF